LIDRLIGYVINYVDCYSCVS